MAVKSPMLDKENASNPSESKIHSNKKKTLSVAPKTPVRTPLRRHNRQPPSSQKPRTPPGSSKVLRQHFQQLSLTPQRTKIQSGAVRVVESSSKAKQKPLITKHKSPPRIGYDGTSKTPSRELLRSTACSRSHQVSSHNHDSLLTGIEVVHTSPRNEKRPSRRDSCSDPVALILLNDGHEDLESLVEQDAMGLSPPPPIQKVSSNLEDVLDDKGVATLVRPVPKVPGL